MSPRLEQLKGALAGRYSIERELGRGGMATVFLAEDLKHRRPVAIKVLIPELASEVGPERFVREIAIEARLQHPNILPLHDSGSARGFLYYVMPYVSGESLRDRLDRKGQLPIKDALRITREVADALSYAHEQGVVHRDIKPENILLSADHALVSDFGIARVISEAGGERVTRTGHAVGTPAYMSPEQAGGETDVDGRSDIYSLGCVLYEMLAGESPFTGHTPRAVIARHMLEPPPPIAVVRPSVGAAIAAAINRALAKSPADRFDSAAEFVAALELPAPKEEATPAVGRTRRVVMQVLRPGYLIALLGLLGLGVGLAWFMREVAARSGDKPSISGVAVAVVPFEVAQAEPPVPGTPSSELHKLFANDLEWVPGLRSLDGTRLIEHVDGWRSADLGELLTHASRFGADYLVTPELLQLEGEPQLTIDVYATHSGERIYRGVGGGTAESIPEAVERIAFELARIIAGRDSLDLGLYLELIPADLSPRALMHLRHGQDRFGASDFDAATAAFQRSIAEDSQFALAYYRLGIAQTWRHDQALALETVERGLVESESAGSLATTLLQAGRHYILGYPDSAITTYQRTILDDPENIDGWLGLGEAIIHLGTFHGNAYLESEQAFERVAALDSGFAPIYTHLFDLALYQRSSDKARRYCRRLIDHPAWPSRQAAVTLEFGSREERARTLQSLSGAERYTISELVSVLAHSGFDLPLADTVASLLVQPDRTYDDRERGAQYRLVVLTALGRWEDAIAVWEAVARRPFDRWLVHTYLAGFAAESRVAPMLAWARSMVAEGRSPDFLSSVSSENRQAFRALVHSATVEGDSADVVELLRNLDSAALPDRSDPMPDALRASLLARLALLAADTTAAIRQLELALARVPSPSLTPFYPLLTMAPQRLLLAELLIAQGSDSAADRWLDSFTTTWHGISDIVYTRSVTRTRRRIRGQSGGAGHN